jgi:hypothetical protein
MQVVQPDLAALERLYTIKDKERVTENLTPELFQLLLEAYPPIRKFFPAANLVLEWHDDPEEEPLSGFILLIETNLEFEEARKMDKQFKVVWWADRRRTVRNLRILVDAKDEF